MTKEELSFMFNRAIEGFFIKKDVLIGREKIHGKKKFMLYDNRTDDEEETVPVVFNSIDELFDYELDGVKIGDTLKDMKELCIDNQFKEY